MADFFLRKWRGKTRDWLLQVPAQSWMASAVWLSGFASWLATASPCDLGRVVLSLFISVSGDDNGAALMV